MSLQKHFLVCVHGFVPNSSLPNTVIHLFVFYTLFDFSHIWLLAENSQHMLYMASQSDFLVFLDLYTKKKKKNRPKARIFLVINKGLLIKKKILCYYLEFSSVKFHCINVKT